jgi:hypothetical protein
MTILSGDIMQYWNYSSLGSGENKQTSKFRAKARCREASSGHWHKLFEIISQKTLKIIQHSISGYVPCQLCIYDKINCGPISIKHSSHVVCTILWSWLLSSLHCYRGFHYELWLKLYCIYFKKHTSWIPSMIVDYNLLNGSESLYYHSTWRFTK